MKKIRYKILAIVVVAISALVLYAYSNSWGKTELLIRIHINEELVRESGFGESPTFAIWLEKPETGETHTIYATRRAADGDWEGKAEVPVALPKWFSTRKSVSNIEAESGNVDGYSGATPKPGYFTKSVQIAPGSKWNCWIEVNLSGDFNENYSESKNSENEADKYLSGQPALLYRAEIIGNIGNTVVPVIVGMTMVSSDTGKIVRPVEGITTAAKIFDEISLSVVRPKPKIFSK